MHTKARTHSAFTLIELLVVIAIIAILAAILFPVFAQAKMAAKKAVDISNMKQMAVAVMLYQNDNDDTASQVSWEVKPSAAGFSPPPFDPGGKYQVHFTYLLQPYFKNYTIFIAPGDPTPAQPAHACPNGSADFGKLDSNGHMYCDWEYPNSYLPDYNVIPAHDWLPVNSTTFPNPSIQIEWADRRYISGDGTTLYSAKKGVDGFNPSQPCTQEGASFDPTLAAQGAAEGVSNDLTHYGFWNVQAILYWQNHMAGNDDPNVDRVWYDEYTGVGNYAFADGHAKSQTLAQTLNPVMGSYEYGDTFYPTINPQDGTCMGGG